MHVVEATHADRLAKLTLLVPLVQYFASVWTHENKAVYSIDIFSSLIVIVLITISNSVVPPVHRMQRFVSNMFRTGSE